MRSPSLANIWCLVAFSLAGCQQGSFTFDVTLSNTGALPLVQRLHFVTKDNLQGELTLSSPRELPASFVFSLPRGFSPGVRPTTLFLFDEEQEIAHLTQDINFQPDGAVSLFFNPSIELNCADGSDDESDGAVDCDDSECAQDASCLPSCGDGQINGDEECEAGDLNGQTCTTLGANLGELRCDSSCRLDSSLCFLCGDGFIDPANEDCDPPSEGGDCAPTCQTAICGDGFVAFASQAHFEACDDGNTIDGDGCSSLCLLEGEHLTLVKDLSGREISGLVASPDLQRVFAIEALSDVQSQLLSLSPSAIEVLHTDIARGLTPLVLLNTVMVTGPRDDAPQGVVELLDVSSSARATILTQSNGAPGASIDSIANRFFFVAQDGSLQKIINGAAPQAEIVAQLSIQAAYLALLPGGVAPDIAAIAGGDQVLLLDLSAPSQPLLSEQLPPGAEVTGLAAGVLLDAPQFISDSNDRGFFVSFRLPSVQKSFVKQFVRASDGSLFGRFLLVLETPAASSGISALSYDLFSGRLLLIANEKLVSLQLKPGSGFLFPDADLDGVSDAAEQSFETNPGSPDTDGDGLHDGFEISLLHDLGIFIFPTEPDSDFDGVLDPQDLP